MNFILGWLGALRKAFTKSEHQQIEDGRTPVTIITGGTEGIGAAFADVFAAAGHDLLLVARSEDQLKAKSSALKASYDIKVACVAADLATAEGCQIVVQTVEQSDYFADILVNNAGIGLSGPFLSHNQGALQKIIDLNVGAVTRLSRDFLPGMIKRGQGGILNIASLASLVPGPNQAAYYASKAYVLSLTEAIAYEIAGSGVRVSAVIPGAVQTEFHDRMGAKGSFYLKVFGAIRPQTVARWGYYGFVFRQTVIAPGLMNVLNYVALSIVPNFIMVPIMGWLLKRRKNRR